MNIDIEKITALATLANEKELAEIEVAEGEQRITIKTTKGTVMAQQVVVPQAMPAAAGLAPAPSVAAAPVSKAVEADVLPANHKTVTAPMVGTFYGSPSPDSPAFVEVGKSVSSGQVLCIIEAMKLMNELESEFSGKVVKLLVENAQPVEFGQPLMIIETA